MIGAAVDMIASKPIFVEENVLPTQCGHMLRQEMLHFISSNAYKFFKWWNTTYSMEWSIRPSPLSISSAQSALQDKSRVQNITLMLSQSSQKCIKCRQTRQRLCFSSSSSFDSYHLHIYIYRSSCKCRQSV